VAAVDGRRLRSHRHAGDRGPGGKCLAAGGMKPGGGVLAGAAGEEIDDLIVGGEKPLHLPRRLEALHDPLSSSGGLMGILRPVVEAFVLAVLDARHDLPLGCGVAAQLVGDQHTRRAALLLHELAEQAFGGFLVAPALDQDIENEAFLVDRAPEPVLLAGDGNDNLVEVPFVAAARGASTDAVGEFTAEFQAPLADRLISHRDATCCQHLLDHTQAQREAEIEPHRVADELCGVAVAGIKRVSRRRHPRPISDHPAPVTPAALNLTVPRDDLGICFPALPLKATFCPRECLSPVSIAAPVLLPTNCLCRHGGHEKGQLPGGFVGQAWGSLPGTIRQFSVAVPLIRLAIFL
jgi:hypothetical protein